MDEWIETDRTLWEYGFENGDNFIYIQDTYKSAHPFNQTELEDFTDDRYQIIIDDALTPDEDVLGSTDDLDEAERHVNAVVEDWNGYEI